MISMTLASWSDYKTIISSKKLLMQYSEFSDRYDIYASEAGIFLWSYSISKSDSTDVSDFESNFKSNANKPLEVRSSANRPARVSASPQPDNTAEHWKGFEVAFGTEDAEVSIYVTYASTIYLRGGWLLPDNVIDGDLLNVEVEAFNGTTWDLVKTPMEDVPLSTLEKIEVVSPECMEFPTYLRLKITITSQTGAARTYRGYLDYYK